MSGLGFIADTPDARDVLFSAPLGGALPASHSLKRHVTGVYSQGATNSCVANALAQALAVERRARGVTGDLALSRLWIYWFAREVGGIQGDSGSRIRDAIRAIREVGCALETNYPFEAANLNRRPPWHMHRAAHDFRGVRQYRRVRTADDVRAALVDGAPVVAGWMVDEAFRDRSGPVDITSLDGPSIGGHALTVVGFDGEWFDVVNSWGASWRDGGHCRFHESLIERAHDAWAIDTVS